MALNGLNGYLVKVETDITGGLPSFDIVGLPDTSVREAKERIRAAIKNSHFEFQSRRILINLAPASTKKEGTSLDLPMAIGILFAFGEIYTKINLSETIFIGELSLDGRINRVNGILPICVDAVKLGMKRVIVARENKEEAGIVKGLEVIPVQSLNEVIDYLNGENSIDSYNLDMDNVLNKSDKYFEDFCDVKGQENIKRALEVAAAGRTQLPYVGEPRLRKNNAFKKITKYFTRFNF